MAQSVSISHEADLLGGETLTGQDILGWATLPGGKVSTGQTPRGQNKSLPIAQRRLLNYQNWLP